MQPVSEVPTAFEQQVEKLGLDDQTRATSVRSFRLANRSSGELRRPCRVVSVVNLIILALRGNCQLASSIQALSSGQDEATQETAEPR
jgi:hypothetical protein